MQQHIYKRQGFTLMELLLVLLLIAGLLLAGRAFYQKYILKKDMAIVKTNVEQLFGVLDRNYFALIESDRNACAAKISNEQSITQNDWKLILPSNLIANVSETPAHPDFVISCENTASTEPAHLIIKAKLNVKAEQLAFYAAKLGGVVDNDQVKWQKIPTYTFAGKDPLWLLSGQLEEFTSGLTVNNYISLSTTQSSFPLLINIVYNDGLGEKTLKMYMGTDSVHNSLPAGVKSINITQSYITCPNGKEFARGSPINNFPVKSGVVKVHVNTPYTSGDQVDLSNSFIETSDKTGYSSTNLNFRPISIPLSFCNS